MNWRVVFNICTTVFGMGLVLVIVGFMGSIFRSENPEQIISESKYVGVQEVMRAVKTLDATDIYITLGGGVMSIISYIQRKRYGQ